MTTAKSRFRHLMTCMFWVVPLLNGCSGPEKKAPEPTVNAHPRAISHLRISAEDGSGVDNVEVSSIWVVGNFNCAPIHSVSGAFIVKQVTVKEKVEKVESNYLATIIDDRFLSDKCHWILNGFDVSFLHDDRILAIAGVAANFGKAGKVELTCIPPPHVPVPVCETRKKEFFDRAHFAGVFNVSLEKVP